MKNSIFLFPFFILLISCNHSKTDYKSSALDAYNDSVSKGWKLEKLNNLKPLEVKNDFLTIVTLQSPTVLDIKNENDYYDSVMKAEKTNVQDERSLIKLFDEIEKTKIGPIVKKDIVKFGNLKNNQAIVYVDDIYNDCFERGYWIALSNDNGKNWEQYYTGLTVNKNYYFKSNSKIPLWKNSNTLQVEAAEVKTISERILPSKSEEFAAVRDSLAIQFDLSKITLDSDNDGLTNIVEEKMLLNSNNPDTDGDGIIDSKDRNPRFKSKKTAKSILYEALMEKYIFENNVDYQIDLSKLPKKRNYPQKYTISISIFVTDDINVKGLEFDNETLVVMTSKEYKAYKQKYPFSFAKKNFSKMFLCDNEKNVYLIKTSSCMSGGTYLIKKNDKGWEVSFRFGYII
jgi:hypothetical protein